MFTELYREEKKEAGDRGGHPESDDVITGDESISRIELCEIFGVLGPSQCRERPERG